MPEISEQTMRAFYDELAKEGAVSADALKDYYAGFRGLVRKNSPLLKGFGAGAGAGATLGALGGGLLGAGHRYVRARDEGESVGYSLGQGLGGALQGAALGGGMGEMVGGSLGAAVSHAPTPIKSLLLRDDLIGKGARFGQRQVHALTGVLERPNEKALAGIKEPVPGMDLTSIPGLLRTAKEQGVGKTLKAGLHAGTSSTLGKSLALGLPALGIASALTQKGEEGTRGEAVGRQAGQLVGSVAGGALPIVGQLAVGGAVGKAGALLGRGVDHFRRGKIQTPPKGGTPGLSPTTLEPAEAQHTPSERIESPAAAGRQNEVGL